MLINRRECLKHSGILAAGMLGLQRYLQTPAEAAEATPFGQLQPDPNGLVNLPPGFRYQVLSTTGQLMDDGLLVPGLHDGMVALPGTRGTTLLIRNHEVDITNPELGAFGDRWQRLDRVDPDSIYDRGRDAPPACGGTTTLLYDTRHGKLLKHFLSLAGTIRNCSGGPTSWGSWLSCEETTVRAEGPAAKDHGYVFEVPGTSKPGLAAPIPYKAMGRFRHEAVAVDDRSGIVYLTEDVEDGLIYRFIPKRKEKLVEGGLLQALCVRNWQCADVRNWTNQSPITVSLGEALDVRWVDIVNVESPLDDLRYQGFNEKGAARFARGEGMWYENGNVYWACTNGGPNRLGQIWRYQPSAEEGQPGEERVPGRLQLYAEPHSTKLLAGADNLTVAPWGDLIVCEDNEGRDHIVGITPKGRMYRIASNALNESEFAGCTFSPDGSTMFVNIQNPGMTLAITGPWRSRTRSSSERST